jgi:integrase
MLGLFLGCGLRRSEVANLEIGKIQRRDGHWAIVDLVGKAGHVRTVPMPIWVKKAIDSWSCAASIGEGRLLRAIRKNGEVALACATRQEERSSRSSFYWAMLQYRLPSATLDASRSWVKR